MLDLAKMSGVNANGLAYGTALAQSTQTSQFTMSGILAGRYMPVVYGVMFAIFTGASLLLLLLMLLPHPMQYIKMYLELLLWLTIWPALMAVYNFIVDLIIQWQASGYLSNYYTTPHGIVLSNVHALTNWVQTSLAWVGYLSWSIPMLSYAIVSGSAMAMTSMVGSMDSAVGGGVSSGASQVGSGNVSFGSMTARDMRIDDVASGNTKSNMYTDNMMSANKIRTAASTELPNGEVYTGGNQSGTLTDPTTGATVGIKNGNASNIGDTQLTGNITKGVSAGTNEAYTAAKSNEQSYGQTWNTNMSNAAGYMQTYGSGLNSDERKAFSADSKRSFVQAVNGDKSLTASQRGELISRFNAEAGGSADGFGAGFEAIQSSSLSQEEKASLAQKYSHDLGQSVSKSGSIGFSKNSSDNASLSNNLTATEGISKTYSDTAKQVNSLSKILSASSGISGTVARNAVLGYMQYFNQKHGFTLGNGYSAEQIAQKDDNEVARLNNNPSALEKYVASNPSILKAEGAVSKAGAGIKPVPSKGIAIADINSSFEKGSNNINSKNPYKYASSPKSVQKKVNELQKKATKYIPAHVTSKNVALSKLTPKQKLAVVKRKAENGFKKAENLVPDIVKAATLGTYYDIVGKTKAAGGLAGNVVNDLTFSPIGKTATERKYHPGGLKITNPKAFRAQMSAYTKLTGQGGSNYGKILSKSDKGSPGRNTYSKIVRKTNAESPLPMKRDTNGVDISG